MAVIRRTRTAAPPAAATEAPVRIVRKPRSIAPPPKPALQIEQIDEDAGETKDSSYKTDYAAVIDRYEKRVKNPLSAIRARCVQCCVGQLGEIKNCGATTCALWPFRLGENPYNKKTRERMEREAAEHEDDE